MDAGAALLDADAAEFDNFGPAGEGGVPDGEPGDIDAYRWLLAWVILIFTLALLNRSRLGHAIMYYALALMLILLVVVNYGFFAWALAPFQFIGRAVNPGARDTSSTATTGAASGTPQPIGEAINTAVVNAAHPPQ